MTTCKKKEKKKERNTYHHHTHIHTHICTPTSMSNRLRYFDRVKRAVHKHSTRGYPMRAQHFNMIKSIRNIMLLYHSLHCTCNEMSSELGKWLKGSCFPLPLFIKTPEAIKVAGVKVCCFLLP